MKKEDINIRDPFILKENDTYYMYGTRAGNFGCKVAGFDVYTSKDLENWSEPVECFNSEKYGLNKEVSWAPEVHKYNGAYYMFATFTRECNLRGTFALRSDNPIGPFVPHSDGALTPEEWECLDGTLYINKEGKPYLVFCHEHTQIIDGTVCYIELQEDLKKSVGKPVYMFSGSTPFYIDKKPDGEHYITDGPFMYRTSNGRLLLIWSTSVNDKYAQCVAISDNDEITGSFKHLDPLVTNDGGHGMLFMHGDQLMLTYHAPNTTDYERPVFRKLKDTGDMIEFIK